MKKYLLLLLLLCVSNSSFSQKKMEVVSFNVKTSDISARTNPREDTNGDISALIKVQLPAPNAFFEGNIIGRVAHKTNEYWVYMPQNSTDLAIKLPGHSSISIAFKDYGIPSLESKVTYELLVLPKEPNAPQLYDEGMTALATNDIVTAYDKLEKAASAGFPYANYILGKSLLEPYTLTEEEQWTGTGWEKTLTADVDTYQAAYDNYKKAADANIPEALYALGHFLTVYNKSLKESDITSSISQIKVSPECNNNTYLQSLIRKSADMGIADAQWEMSKDRRWCEENAKNGIAIAEFVMGLRCDSTAFDGDEDYPHAHEIGRDYSDAEEHLLHAAHKTYFQEEEGYIETGPSEWKHEAFEWYKKAAEKGLDAAQWKLGYMYTLGIGTEKDLNKAIYWRKKAAEQGYIVYQLEMAMSYNYGVICDLPTYLSWGTAENGMAAWEAEIPRNADDADFWLRKVSNRELISSQERDIIDGNSMYSDAMFYLAQEFEKRGEYAKSIYWYQRVGESNDYDHHKSDALGEVGRFLYEGLTGDKNYIKAKSYFEKGLEAEGWLATCYLGILYRDGFGVEKDLDTAKDLFMKSISFEKKSQPYYELAKLYYEESKYELAIRFYEETCMCSSVDIYTGFDGGKEWIEKAIKEKKFFNYREDVTAKIDGVETFIVIDEYKTSAILQLGLMYLDGVGVEMDKNKAVEFISKAAYRGSEEAKAKLKELGFPDNNGEIYQRVEVMPEFPGGMDMLLEYLSRNIKYPKIALDQGIQGKVVVEFIVNKDGSIVDPKVVRSLHPLCDAEAIRVIKAMPKWKPGKVNGEPVRVKYSMQISFNL